MSSRILHLLTATRTAQSLASRTRVGVPSCGWARSYHLSSSRGSDWRKERGLPRNSNAYGPVTDGPDYSFIDGRPTPPGSGKIKRAEKQLKLSKKIMELSKEMDFAQEFKKQRDAAEEERKARILDRKLKPKGTDIEE